jgi:hypothetical protein
MVPLTLGQFAVIDACDWPLIGQFKWYASRRSDGDGFYVVSAAVVRMHRLLLGATRGEIVDHRDGNGLNNTRQNIRKGTQALNCVNRRRTPGPYMRGAQLKKGRWRAMIKINGRMCSLGYFATETEAHEAYLAAATKRYGDWMPLPKAPE